MSIYMTQNPVYYSNIEELAGAIDNTLLKRVKEGTIDPSICISKISLCNKFKISHNVASRVWQMLREKGYTVDRFTVTMPKQSEPSASVSQPS